MRAVARGAEAVEAVHIGRHELHIARAALAGGQGGDGTQARIGAGLEYSASKARLPAVGAIGGYDSTKLNSACVPGRLCATMARIRAKALSRC